MHEVGQASTRGMSVHVEVGSGLSCSCKLEKRVRYRTVQSHSHMATC